MLLCVSYMVSCVFCCFHACKQVPICTGAATMHGFGPVEWWFGPVEWWLWSSWVMIGIVLPCFAMACLDFTVFCVDVNRSFDREVETQLDICLEDPWLEPRVFSTHIYIYLCLQINQRTWWYISISHRGFYGNFMIHIVIKRWTHRLGLIRFTQAVSPSPAKNRVRVGKNVPFISGSFSEVFSILVVLFIILEVVFFCSDRFLVWAY